MPRSWLDGERTVRGYHVEIDLECPQWVVKNEYRKVKCPDCSSEQYLRLTHIWYIGPEGRRRKGEYHVNLNKELDPLKKLQVTYIYLGGKRTVLYERLLDNVWCLVAEGKIIGQEVDISQPIQRQQD